jgi:hypothetical protein
MPIQHPIYSTFKAERNHMHSCLSKFGLAPSEQARVTTAIRAQLKLFEPHDAAPGATDHAAEPRGFSDF